MARRISKSSVDWAKMAEMVPENQKALYYQFKSRSDAYLRKVSAYPEQPPAINWDMYKNTLSNPALVESLKKQFESLNVPYPADKVSPHIDAQKNETVKEIAEFIKASEDRIASYKAELTRLGQMVPFEHMTLEDFADSFPDKAIDPINRPTFWPHTPEDQPEALEKQIKELGQDHH